MKKNKKLHINFIEYQKKIINHPNYKDMPDLYNNDGSIRWIVTKNSEIGKKREKWWRNKKKNLIKEGVIFPNNEQLHPVCLYLHPTKKKIDSTTGIEWDIRYVYPNKNTLKKINKFFDKSYQLDNELTIFKILDEIYDNKKFYLINKIFPGVNCKESLENIKEFINKEFVNKFQRGLLSPGAMANPPDRLDGFHNHCLGMRSTEDSGRSKSNLQKYGEDRRAYEYWTDGDWKLSAWLMKEFNKHGLSADHIGPISLGFSNRPSFNPMSARDNSAKGNRLTLADFNQLINDEKNGDKVVSWHIEPLWNKVKSKIKIQCNTDARKLSKLMRQNLHYNLIIFYELYSNGFKDFLESFLNPSYAFYNHKFKKFNKKTGEYEVLSKKGSITQYKNNAKRYVRKSFEYLKKYKKIENRKLDSISEKKIKDLIEQFKLQPNKDNLLKILDKNADYLIKKYY